MKTLRYSFIIGSLMLFLGCVTACKKESKEFKKAEEQMALSISSDSIALDENNPAKDILTFSWKEARALSGDHLVSYTTKLDLTGNNFGTATAIMNYEDDGTVSRSFTSEQLQNWAKEKWGVPSNRTFTLEFRVIAQWEGGATFEAPEVRTVTVKVKPINAVAFDADKIFLDGSAISEASRVEMPATLENLNQYAFMLDLQPGELQIPVEFNGVTNFIAAADANATLLDGTAVSVKIRESPFAWKITAAGRYRVIVNMQKATATIYSPEQALTPLTVNWNGDGGLLQSSTITELWMHGAINSFGTPIKMDCKVSLADPQVLVYTGGRDGKVKFIVYGGADNNKNLAYAFSCPLTDTGVKQEQVLISGKVAELSGGASSAQRNSYYTIPAGTNVLVMDLRNNTILAEKR